MIDVEISSHTLSFRGRPAVVVVAEDVSERVRLEEMKDAILTAVSHELRTPLTALLGFARTLEQRGDEIGEEERGEFAQAIVSQAEKLERLLTDLLDVDRLNRGIVAPRRANTDLTAMAQRLVAETHLSETHPVRLETSRRVTADVDGAKVERILENLLINAARHTEAGTPVWIDIRTERDGVLLVVEDDGPGVPQDFRATIFEPFRQGPTIRKHSPGVGVGLSLVARFAELHGGAAWVEERAGGGASFRVFLPAS